MENKFKGNILREMSGNCHSIILSARTVVRFSKFVVLKIGCLAPMHIHLKPMNSEKQARDRIFVKIPVHKKLTVQNSLKFFNDIRDA